MSNPPTLAEFLLARIAEDEVAAQVIGMSDPDFYSEAFPNWTGLGVKVMWVDHEDGSTDYCLGVDSLRMLNECRAKRLIVERFRETAPPWSDSRQQEINETLAEDVLPFLALPYARHRDYREEWRP